MNVAHLEMNSYETTSCRPWDGPWSGRSVKTLYSGVMCCKDRGGQPWSRQHPITHPDPPSCTPERYPKLPFLSRLWVYFLSISLTKPLVILCTIWNWRWPVLSPWCGPWAFYKRQEHIWLCFQGYATGPRPWVAGWIEQLSEKCLHSYFFLIIIQV